MNAKARNNYLRYILLIVFIFISKNSHAENLNLGSPGNFSLPGLIDLPTARRFPDGELVITQQLHRSLARSAISFQALPRVGFAFRYTGHGIGGGEAYGRINHDRSFDAHFSILDEGKFLPAISIGLRDFIGTGWYSSEYLVGTKKIGDFEFTAGLGFGRLAGKDPLSNPLGNLSAGFNTRDVNNFGLGGTLGNINWFHGKTSVFYGFNYNLGEKIVISSEYNPDLMSREQSYLDISSYWNFGLSYQINDYLSLATQILHGDQISLTAHINLNPERAPMSGGKELAPVPMRIRGPANAQVSNNNIVLIKKVLAADNFKINEIKIDNDKVWVSVSNTKFRSTAQAVGRVASTLQRFTADQVKSAYISFTNSEMQIGSFYVDLEQIGKDQFDPKLLADSPHSIAAIDLKPQSTINSKQRLNWGIGPYLSHRLFNPDLPLSMETGIEVVGEYEIRPGLKLSGAVRKSVITNLTDNKRRSNSKLPRVHSDWPLYDIAGQPGHIHELAVSYTKNLGARFYGRLRAGLLEPHYAGVSGEILYKPAQSPFAVGVDIHRVRKREYDMRLDLRDYRVNIGHLNLYYDAGGMFDFEVNIGRYLAGDWGATTTISRKFGNGWEVGGYATFTDVPFETFGEGSFDKAIYVSIPIDWIISSPQIRKNAD